MVFFLFVLAASVGLYFYVKYGKEHYKPIKPIELEILSSESLSTAIVRVKFRVVFRIEHLYGFRRLYFNTTGIVEADEVMTNQR